MRVEAVNKLEKDLSAYLFKRRVISATVLCFSLILGIVFSLVREFTKEVVVHGEGFFSYETVTYYDYYVIGIVIGFLTATVLGCVLFTDLIFCRFQTTTANNYFITVYRGMNKCSVYIDGEEKDSLGMLSFSNVIDTKLPDGTKICVSFSRGAFMIAHISYFDHNLSIDL